MKKLLVILFLIPQILIFADVVEKTYTFEDPTFLELNGYNIVEFENTMQQANTGEPVLPYRSISLLLPPGEIASSIDIISSNLIEIPGDFNLYPKQNVRPVSEEASKEFVINQKIYSSNSEYPQKPEGYLTTQFLNGFSLALSTFTPVVYVPASGKLSYFQNVTVRINTEASQKAQIALNNLRTDESSLDRITKFAQNPQDITKYPDMNTREGEYQLLIITPAQFENEFEDMREVYLMQGMLSELMTTEDIYATTTGQDQQEKIRNYIIQEYQDHFIEYVLLAGDVEHVPYRGFYCTVASGAGYEDDDIPSDLYYSALDGTWNDDGDNYWGEIGEDDLLPEVAVARFSFSGFDDLANMLNKTISYQTQPVLGELRDPLLAGENMYNNPLTWGGDYLDLLIGYHDDNGYETTGIPEDHNITKMYDRDMGTWSGSQLISEINQGHSFIHHAGHSNYEYAMRLNNPDITNANFNMVNGVDHNYSFVYTHGCNCGSFDHNDGIGERMINIENFLVAFVGNSRYGWFNEGQTEGPSAHIHREFIDALYNNKYHRIGRAHMESKTETAPWLTAPGQHEEGAIRWCFYDCNVLGGSAVPIWTDEPIDIDATYQPIIILGSSELLVNILSNGETIENMQCTLLQDGNFIGTASTNSSGDATIEFDPNSIVTGDIELYISGYNRPTEMYQLQVVTNGNFVSVEGYSIESGNDDVIEFGENALLSLTLEELGNTGDIHNVIVEISSNDEFITLNDVTENVGTINSGSTVELTDAFDFNIDNEIPNEHAIPIDIQITSDEGVWDTQIELMGYNAELEVTSIEIQDEDDGFLDPGETADIVISLHNVGGADAYNLDQSISSTYQDISVTSSPAILDSINADMTQSITFSVEVGENAQVGDIVDFELNVTADNELNFTFEFEVILGVSIEDFESGDFSSFEWMFGGNENWMIDNEAYEGSYAAKTGAIGNNATSSLQVELEISSAGDISFWKKVSSELNYDYFKFYIDDDLQEQWSGEIDWSESVYSVDVGTHTFKWEYFKDGGVTGGSDCAWLDYIIFPPIADQVNVNDELIPNVTKLLGNYPNPFNPTTTISFNLNTESTKNTELIIYNIKGQIVKQLVNEPLASGLHSIVWNGKDDMGRSVASGVYFYQLNVNNKNISSKKCLLLK